METIYIDRLFALNFIIDYFILLGSAKVSGVKLRRQRYVISSVVGALYAALSVLPDAEFLSLAPIKLVSGILMALIAFGKEEKLLRCTLVFFAVSALFGGAVWAISLGSGVSASGAVYIPLSMPVLVFSFGIIYAVLSLAFRCTAKNAGRQVFEVEVTHNGSTAELRALYDTGNGLIDPVTGDGVMIASVSALCKLIPNCEAICAENISDFPEYKLRLIPYRAVGTSGGLLPAFRPEKITVNGKERDDILIAISNQVGGDGFNAIF